MKILLVHPDKNKWATTSRALEFKKRWTNDQVDIAYFKDLPDGNDYDVIHFLFSRGLTDIKEYILKHQNKSFTTLASFRSIENAKKLPHLIEIYQKTRVCVCLNPWLAKKLKLLTRQNNVVYIPNGVDERLFNREFVVGFVGADTENDHKGLSLIKRAANELGLTLKVAYGSEGVDIQSKMPDFYKSVDCIVLASVSEGCNNPTLEALAMNKPVISTVTGIVNELEGIITIERNVESIKNALRKLSGRIQILESYTWDKIAQKYHDLYQI